MSLGSNNVRQNPEASDVGYSGASSGMSAENAQAAIDELRELIDELKTELMNGEITIALATTSGEVITTESGEEILAVHTTAGKAQAYTDAVVAAAMAAAYGKIERYHDEYKANKNAVDAALASLDNAITAV